MIGGETVEYDAVVASTTLTNGEGEDSAELFYTAYFRTDGAPSEDRPLVFAYNGGPGSASFWLHMGIMGPRRVVTPGVGPQGAPPYPLEDNAFTVLDIADIVMVDPIGTGFSHPVGETEGSYYWGIDEDARSLSQFVRRFLSEYDRWNSPRFLLGESYGTTRSAVLAGPPAAGEHRPERHRARLGCPAVQHDPVRTGRRPALHREPPLVCDHGPLSGPAPRRFAG